MELITVPPRSGRHGARRRLAVATLATIPLTVLLAVAAAGPADAGVRFAGGASGALNAGAVVSQPFAADSGDRCGAVSGQLGWSLGPQRPVLVTGAVTDRCTGDGRVTTATFTGIASGLVVDTLVARADDGGSVVDGSLAPSSPTSRRIDTVVVRVCRGTAATPSVYCGPAQRYRAPVSTGARP